MKYLLSLLLCLFTLAVSSQNEQLAQNYFDKGDFDKARLSFEELHAKQPSNSFYFQRLLESNQQLQQFEEVERLIQQRLAKYKQASLLVELGYNFQLKKDLTKAKKYYEEALDRIRNNPQEVY